MDDTPAHDGIRSLTDLETRLGGAAGAVFCFSTPQCNVCKVLRPKVEALLADAFPRMGFHYVDCEALPDAAAQYRVFAVPTLLVVFDGREVHRFSRNLGIGELREAIERPYALFFE